MCLDQNKTWRRCSCVNLVMQFGSIKVADCPKLVISSKADIREGDADMSSNGTAYQGGIDPVLRAEGYSARAFSTTRIQAKGYFAKVVISGDPETHAQGQVVADVKNAQATWDDQSGEVTEGKVEAQVEDIQEQPIQIDVDAEVGSADMSGEITYQEGIVAASVEEHRGKIEPRMQSDRGIRYILSSVVKKFRKWRWKPQVMRCKELAQEPERVGQRRS